MTEGPGETALLVDPTDIDLDGEALVAVVSDRDLSDALAAQDTVFAKARTWELAAARLALWERLS